VGFLTYQEEIGLLLMQTQELSTKDVVKKAREYLGVPFLPSGRSKNGLDCTGLPAVVYAELGLTNYDIKRYAPTPQKDTFYIQLSKCPDIVRVFDVTDLQDGDLIIMALPSYPCHIGIKTDIGMIHSYNKIGKVVEHRLNKTWKKSIRFVFRHKRFA